MSASTALLTSVSASAALLALLLVCGPEAVEGQAPVRHELRTTDGVSLPGWWFEGTNGTEPVIALFHQGGASGMAEYEPIVPRLQEAGYRLLVIDQRRGGTLFDGANEVSPHFDDETTSYCDAMLDVEAALDFALERADGEAVVLWGSSYSAALVIDVASRRPSDIAGVVALSPASGEPMAGCEPDVHAATLQLPLLVGRPTSEMEIESVAAQLALFADAGHTTFVADPGRHGSSMLVEERVGSDVSRSWSVVLDFLASLR